MFYGCYNMVKVPPLDTSLVTTFNSMFYTCSSLIDVPQMDVSSATMMEAMFSGCYNIISIPELDADHVTTMKNMFNSCYALSSAPLINTSSVTNMDAMFTTTTSLVTIPEVDMQSVTSVSSAPFNKCYALKDVRVKNMKVSTSFANSYFLNKDSLLYMINNEASESAITITLNAKAYTDLAEDEDVLAALASHPNISLAK